MRSFACVLVVVLMGCGSTEATEAEPAVAAAATANEESVAAAAEPAAEPEPTSETGCEGCRVFDGDLAAFQSVQGMSAQELQQAGSCYGSDGHCDRSRCTNPQYPTCNTLHNNNCQCSR